LIPSTHLQDFALAAAGTGQRQAQFAGRFVKIAGEAKAIRAALEALHVETPEGAFGRGAWRFVVLAPDKVAGGIHATHFAPSGWTSADQPRAAGNMFQINSPGAANQKQKRRPPLKGRDGKRIAIENRGPVRHLLNAST